MADKQDTNKEEAVEIDYSELFAKRKSQGEKPTERGSKDSKYNGVHR